MNEDDCHDYPPRRKSKHWSPTEGKPRTPIANPGNRPECPACGCPDMCEDTGRCDCIKHVDCFYGWQRR